MNPEQFQRLNEKKKEEFLSNDMAERIMRVEQRVSSKFGKLIPYKNTEYYKSLTPLQKESFEKYLKNKGKKKILILALFLIPVLFIFLLNMRFTGNVINENFVEYNFLDYLLTLIILILLIFLMINLKSKKSRNRKIEGHIRIIDNWLAKKFGIKRHLN